MLRRSAGLILFLLMASPALTDDLAAAARKEKERRAKLANPARVYTEGDAKNAAVGSVTTLSGSTSSPAPADPPPSGQSPDQQKAAWKARAEAARLEILTAKAGLAAMENELSQYRSDMGAPTEDVMDPMRLQNREARMVEMRAAIEQQKVVVANATRSLDVLETEARKSGVPPGWLR